MKKSKRKEKKISHEIQAQFVHKGRKDKTTKQLIIVDI
jgi:hypothetical protein